MSEERETRKVVDGRLHTDSQFLLLQKFCVCIANY